MTPEQVVAASEGTAQLFVDKKKHDPRLGEVKAVGVWIIDASDGGIGQIRFPVKFWFINGALAHVNIDATDNGH